MSEKIAHLTSETVKSAVASSATPLLVDFWAPWCGPCKMMAPVLEELAESFAGKLKIAKLDVDEEAHRELAMKYRIQSIPALKVFRGGEVVKDFIGFRPKDVFEVELNKELQ